MVELSSQELKLLSEIIYEATGIKIEKKKLGVLEVKLRIFMNRKGFNSIGEIMEGIKKDKSLFEELIAAVTVNETYFFREKEHFDVLVDIIKENGMRSAKILSIPCSTGEEPYSIAMYLEEHFGKGLGYEIIGVDIDKYAISRAKEGIYHKKSLMKLSKDILSKYFIEKDGLYYIKPKIKKKVLFYVGNVFDHSFLKRLGLFDFVFCRNLFIYFDNAKKEEALKNIYTILKKGGYLFLAKTEFLFGLQHSFIIERKGKTIVYRK